MKYRGWFGSLARRRCPHSTLRGIYGDEINAVGGWRLQCFDCGALLDGHPALATVRYEELTRLSEITRQR